MRAWRSYAQTPSPSGQGGPGNGFGRAFIGGVMTPVVKVLLIANVALEVVAMLGARGWLFHWFAFQPGAVVARPWGLLTYAVVHGGLGHLLVNMLVLFFFGPPLERRWGGKAFGYFTLWCALGGAVLSFAFMPNAVVGFSAAGYGIMLAFAAHWPDARIYVWAIFPVKAKYVVAFLFVISAMSAVGGAGDGVAHFAHLGGIGAAAICLRYGRVGIGSRLAARNRQLVGRVGTGPKARTTGARRVRTWNVRVSRPKKSRWSGKGSSTEGASGRRPTERSSPAERKATGRRGRPSDDGPVSPEMKEVYDRVDAILDKISASGLSSLTAKERSFLDRVSRRHGAN